MRFLFAVFLLVSAAAFSSPVFAQGADGRSDSVASPAKRDAKPARKRPARRPVQRKPAAKPRPKPPALGKLELRVNEGASVIELLRLQPELEPLLVEVISAPASSSSLIIRSLPVGQYKIAARKPGFGDEWLEFKIVRRRKKRIDVVLRPTVVGPTSVGPNSSVLKRLRRT